MRKIVYDKATLAVVGVYSSSDEVDFDKNIFEEMNIEFDGCFHLERNENDEIIVVEDSLSDFVYSAKSPIQALQEENVQLKMSVTETNVAMQEFIDYFFTNNLE